MNERPATGGEHNRDGFDAPSRRTFDPATLPPTVSDLLRRYMLPDRGTAADRVFTELRGAGDVDSLTQLVDRVGRPLVRVRCAADGRLLAAVWRTSAGPLVVTAHRVETWSQEDRARVGGAGDSLSGSNVRRSWTPRVALSGDDLGRVLPLPCPVCREPRPLTATELASAVGAALTGAPADVRT